MSTLSDAFKAQRENDATKAYELTLRVLIEEHDEEYRVQAKEIYAWSLRMMGRLGEALQRYRELEKYYAKVAGGQMSSAEAKMIMEQVRILRKLGIMAAAEGLLGKLLKRIDQETRGSTTDSIRTKLKDILGV